MATLSHLLRTSTQAAHEHAETRSFVTSLMGGTLTRAAYLDLAAQHHVIYTALEGAAQRFAGDEFVGRFVMPEILRLPRLEADLGTLLGQDWRAQILPLPSTARYAERLEGLRDPAHFLAHAYTRYLGDLSGGQAIAAMLRRHYGFTPGELTFYSFDVGKIKPFKDRYRQMMDQVPFSPDQARAAAAEAQVAFELNAAVFVDLAALHPTHEGDHESEQKDKQAALA